MVPEMQKDQREKGDAGERMPYRPHMPYIVALRLSGDMQSHPGRNAASVINILRFPLIFFPQSNGGTNMRTMDGTG